MNKTNKKGPGIRCVECGCRLDPGERCDCEKLAAERAWLETFARRRKLIAHNMRMMEQAQREFDYS